MKKARKFKRLDILVDHQSELLHNSKNKIINISLGGCCLLTFDRLKVGDRYAMKVRSKYNPKSIVVYAVVKWGDEFDESMGHRKYGLEFIDDPEAIQVLQEIVNIVSYDKF